MAETIELKLIDGNRPKALRWELASSYEQTTFVQLIQMVMQNKHPDGYETLSVKKFNSQKLSNSATISLQQVHTGDHLRVEVFTFKTHRHVTWLLPKHNFFA